MFSSKKHKNRDSQQVITKASQQRDVFLKSFVGIVENHSHIVIFQHINPDGDCVGCSLGLKKILQEQYPDKKIYSVGASHGLYPWLTQDYDVLPDNFDYTKALAVIVDVGTSERIDFYDLHFKKPDKKFSSIVKIDHHESNTDFKCNLAWDDMSYMACACQILQICEFYNWDVCPKASTYLYLGLTTDSGSFKYVNVLPRSFILAAKALRYGADAEFLNKHLSARSFKNLERDSKLISYIQRGQNLLWMDLDQPTLKSFGIVRKSGLVNLMANLEDNIMWILFTEDDQGVISVDFRSIGVVCRDLAIEYGGGGHDFAAGCLLKDPSQKVELLAKATKIVSDYIAAHKDDLLSNPLSAMPSNSLYGDVMIDASIIDDSKATVTEAKDAIHFSQEAKAAVETPVEAIASTPEPAASTDDETQEVQDPKPLTEEVQLGTPDSEIK